MLKILYVEDNANARDTVKRGLELSGETVLLASDARTGLALARQEHPDVILLDIGLGEVDGLILAAQLQAAPELANTVMIAYTAADQADYQSRALAAGCVGYLIKGIKPSELMSHIRPYAAREKRDQLIDSEQIKYMHLNTAALVNELQSRVDALDTRFVELHTAQAGLIRSERLAAIGRMSLSVAHELNNPLQVVIGALDLLRSKLSDLDEQQQILEIALGQAERAAKIIDNMLTVHTLDAERASQVDVVALIEDVVTLVFQTIDKSAIQVTIPNEKGMFIIQGAYAQFYQVILNLVLNAVEAMPGGGRLRITVECVAQKMIISVADSGVGIVDGSNVFEPFYTTKPTGHGLGLYVCRLIASAYNAQVSWYNTPPRGVTFTFTLPMDLPTE